MDPSESNLKRKRPCLEPTPPGGWLHPGGGEEWRGSKKARSILGSRSPSPSGVSTSSKIDASEPVRTSWSSRGLAKLLPQSQERRNASDTRASPQSPTPPSGSATANPIASTRNSMGTARPSLEEAFRKLRVVTDTLCPPLGSAIDDLTACLHVFEANANNRQEYNDLTEQLKSLVEQLIRYLHASPSEDITDSISNISEAIRKEIESIGARQSRSGIGRILDASGDNDDLCRRYRRIKQLFQQILGEASMSTWCIASEHFVNTQLESLHPAKLARFDSSLSTEINRRTCTENTRTKILQDSLAWSEDPNGAKLYWMNGMAGTGKTTIAATLCTTLEARKQLAASFFCTRTSPECREAKRIVPTIAYQFSRRSTPFRSALSKALKEDPDIGTGSISSQFELLLRRPLIKVKATMPDNLVIVVDALDECNDPHIVELFLNLIFRSIVDMPIKLYVTSRPEPVIRNRMMSENERTRSVLYLHEIEKSLVQADIELYLKEELEFMTPAGLDVKKLAERADNLFIYAATAVRYIRPIGKLVDSQMRLATVLAVNTKSKQKLSGLDALYSAILVAAADDQDLELEERERMRLVLWTVICACEPILIRTLSALCGLNNKVSTVNALQPLQSVLHVSDHNELVTTLHMSFPDYMLSQERSGVFFCDKAAHNQFLAQRCFDIMQAQLRFNIGSIKSSFIPDSEIPDLRDRILINISDELFYACRFIADHLGQASTIQDLLPRIHIFLSQQLLFWMEVLNLKECLAAGVTTITKLNKWLLRNDLDAHPNLLELASSASIFIISFISSPASAFTPHIYLSLLPLSSPSNMVRLCYMPRFKGLITASGTFMNRLKGSPLSKWTSNLVLKCATFSPSTDLIALGSRTGEICVQNAYSGRYLVRPYKAHDAKIQCLDISNNGLWIVSGSYDCTLCIWSVQDGSLISGPYEGHTSPIRSVRFSPDSVHLVSGSDDHSVGVWVSNNTTVSVRLLTGHQEPVRSVDFSPDGTRIVSSSNDCTIRVWDLSSKATLFIISCQIFDVSSIDFVRFTPDGAHIVSASARAWLSHIFHSWDASNGSLYGPTIQARFDLVSSLAISPDGNNIALASLNGTVCVYDRHTGKLVATPLSVLDVPTKLLAFSDDGMRIVSAHSDTVEVWNAYSREEQTNYPSRKIAKPIHPYFIISPNRARVAETFRSSIHVWDPETAAMIISIPINSEYGETIFLQFSFDGTRIFSLSEFGKLCTWETDSAKLINGPHLCSTIGDKLELAVCSSDGTRVVTCSRKEIELWDAQSCRSITYLELDEYDGSSQLQVMFSQSGRRLMTNVFCASQIVLHGWDVDSGMCFAGPFLDKALLDISPDGSVVLTSAQRHFTVTQAPELQVINVNSGVTSNLNNLFYDDAVSWTVMFSTDGLHVIAASPIKCQIWDICGQIITEIKPVWTGRLRLFTYSSSGWCQAFSTSDEAEEGSFEAWYFRISQPFYTEIDSDGWLRDGQSRPLLWVPEQIRDDFAKDRRARVKNGESFNIDYSDMMLGDEWCKCYIGD